MNLSEAEKSTAIEQIKNNQAVPKEILYKLLMEEKDTFFYWKGKEENHPTKPMSFHAIKRVTAPRISSNQNNQNEMFDLQGALQQDWTNRLFWGDNKILLSSLLSGSARDEIEKTGGIKLIYCDPPFALGNDFLYTIKMQDEKNPQIKWKIYG